MSLSMHERTVMPPEDPDVVANLAELLSSVVSSGHAILRGPDGTYVELPEPVYRVLIDVVDAMSRGLAITVAPHNTLLTTQEAADLLGISRPTLVRLLEAGEIPFAMRGRHRRIQLVDVVEYQRASRVAREQALDELARDGGEAGMYEATIEPMPPR